MVDASSCQAEPSPAPSVQSAGACNGMGALQARSVQCCVVEQTTNWQGPGRPPEHNVPGAPAPGSLGFWSRTGHVDFPRPSFPLPDHETHAYRRGAIGQCSVGLQRICYKSDTNSGAGVLRLHVLNNNGIL